MIVKCEQCQTRFKIPDDKITDKGVKVRCTKCQHTFRVKRDGTTMEIAAAGEGGAQTPSDPFSKFGPSQAADPSESTRPGVFAAGVQATKNPLEASYRAQAPTTPQEAFDAPTRVARLELIKKPASEAKGAPAGAPFDFSGMSAPAANPFDFSKMSPQPAAARPAPASFDPQPFDFSQLSPGQSEVTVKAPMPQAPKSAPSSFEPQPFDFSQLSPAPNEVTVKAARPSAPKPPPPPSSFEPQPFDFSSLGGEAPPPPPPSRPPPGQAPPSQFEPAALDFSTLETAGPPPPAPAPRASTPRAAPSAPKAARASSPPPPAARRVEDLDVPDLSMDLSAPPPGPAAKTQADLPAPSGLLADVPFSDDALAVDEGDGLKAEPGARGALFDMAAPDAAEPVNQLAAAQDQVAVAKIALKRVSSDQLEAPIPLPPPAETPAQTDSRSRRPRGVVAMVWNVLSAVMLVVLVGAIAGVVLNDGKIDPSQSWKKLKSAFSTPRELVAFDISNGLYDTRAGRPVFYVRGAIKNRGNKSGRVKVKAEILDGEDLIRAAEGFAGATPSPEDLWSVTTAEDLEHLSAKLVPTAQKLAPGDEAPFLVAFYEYPPDLKDFRVRVTVSPDDGKTAAR